MVRKEIVISAGDFTTAKIALSLPTAVIYYKMLGEPVLDITTAGRSLVAFAVIVQDLHVHHGGLTAAHKIDHIVKLDASLVTATDYCLLLWQSMMCDVQAMGWPFSMDDMIAARKSPPPVPLLIEPDPLLPDVHNAMPPAETAMADAKDETGVDREQNPQEKLKTVAGESTESSKSLFERLADLKAQREAMSPPAPKENLGRIVAMSEHITIRIDNDNPNHVIKTYSKDFTADHIAEYCRKSQIIHERVERNVTWDMVEKDLKLAIGELSADAAMFHASHKGSFIGLDYDKVYASLRIQMIEHGFAPETVDEAISFDRSVMMMLIESQALNESMVMPPMTQEHLNAVAPFLVYPENTMNFLGCEGTIEGCYGRFLVTLSDELNKHCHDWDPVSYPCRGCRASLSYDQLKCRCGYSHEPAEAMLGSVMFILCKLGRPTESVLFTVALIKAVSGVSYPAGPEDVGEIPAQPAAQKNDGSLQ